MGAGLPKELEFNETEKVMVQVHDGNQCSSGQCPNVDLILREPSDVGESLFH